MRPPFQLPDSVTSFHDYFRLTAESDRVAEALGYGFVRSRVELPRTTADLQWVTEPQKRLEQHVNLFRVPQDMPLLLAVLMGILELP